jgi:uncharacterized RDD family membrane protein YckC
MSQLVEGSDFTLQTLDSVELKLPLAGVGARSYAFVIDWHIRVIAAVLWAIAAAVLSRYEGWPKHQADVFIVGLPALFIYLGYHPLLEVVQRGRTPGKRIAGLRIVADDGGAPESGALILRNLFRLIDSLPMFYGLGILLMSISSRPLRVGDLATGTLVVFDTAPDKKAVRTETLLGDHNINPQWILLADELLRRWEELQPDQREALAQRLLERAGREFDSMSRDRHAALERLRAGKP